MLVLLMEVVRGREGDDKKGVLMGVVLGVAKWMAGFEVGIFTNSSHFHEKIHSLYSYSTCS
jgi:hypothetical protein